MTNFILDNNGTDITFENVGSLVGFEYPQISNVVVAVPGKPGDYFVNSDYKSRRLSWQSTANNAVNRREILGIQIGSLKTLKFTTCDLLMLQVDVEMTRIVSQYQERRTVAMFDAIAPDYRLLSQTLNTSSTQVTVVTGGTALPTELPLSFSSSGGTPSLTINNAGNAPAAATFTITGPGTDFIVQNQTTGQSFNINLTLLTGETVVVNTQDRTVIKGTTNQYGSFSGDFWELAPGDNEIFFNASSGTDDNTLLQIDYRDSYLGI
jgi:phage-related protein